MSAQSGAFMDRFLEEGQVAYGDAAYLVLVGAGLLKDGEPVERALAVLEERGWAIAGKGASDPLTLGEFAFLVTRSFEIPGGLMYHVAPGPRYATRELAVPGGDSGQGEAGVVAERGASRADPGSRAGLQGGAAMSGSGCALTLVLVAAASLCAAVDFD